MLAARSISSTVGLSMKFLTSETISFHRRHVATGELARDAAQYAAHFRISGHTPTDERHERFSPNGRIFDRNAGVSSLHDASK
jgi:hypothetical protein